MPNKEDMKRKLEIELLHIVLQSQTVIAVFFIKQATKRQFV